MQKDKEEGVFSKFSPKKYPRRLARQLNKTGKKVFVGLSGGVDSSVAAALLKQEGYNVVGAFMRFWSEDGHRENGCCSASAEAAARLVAAKLEIPFYVFGVAKEFKKKVVDYFLRELKAGRTPNPCVVCNPQIKFGLFLKRALKLGADYMATGHYSELKMTIKNGKSVGRIFAAKDDKKDQSYFLVGLKQRQLGRIIFPLGDHLKKEAYDLALKWRLPYRQGESFDICFIDDYQQFLKKYLKMKPGKIIGSTGYELGQHQGLPLYTIGQRVNIGGPGPFYLVRKDVKKNILYVSNNEKDLLRKEMQVEKLNWLSGQSPKFPLRCFVKIRYRCESAEAVIRFLSEQKLLVTFEKPQRAITPGQSAVFYSQKREMLGGGVIA